jgi:Tfp pilus assembly protein PilW
MVELLLYMALFSILLTILTSIFISIMDLRLESQAFSHVEDDGKYIVSRLVYDIPQATSITTPATLGSQSNSFVLVINGQTHTYAISSGNLNLTNTNGTHQLNGYDTTISNFSITRLGSNTNTRHTFKISFDVTSKTSRPGQGTETKNFMTTVGLR